jgi:Tfp pilus assembly protein PilO
MAETPKSTPVLLILVALGIGYIGYTGDVLDLIGVEGVKAKQERATAMQDTLTNLQARIDTAKRSLAVESVEDVRARTEAYRTSLGVLRTLVPEETEVADLIDDIHIRAKVRGVDVVDFGPQAPVPGPDPFDTYSYNFAVMGRYNQVGAFLTDIASLRRIIVAGDVVITRADVARSRVMGDTVSMLEARFKVRTYVKAQSGDEVTSGL